MKTKTKKCTKCKKRKSIKLFYHDKNRKDKRTPHCSVCVKSYAKTKSYKKYSKQYKKTAAVKKYQKRYLKIYNQRPKVKARKRELYRINRAA
ncbi:hypothetical protein ACFLQL_00475 [Verrucomicrobiota bacterium]